MSGDVAVDEAPWPRRTATQMLLSGWDAVEFGSRVRSAVNDETATQADLDQLIVELIHAGTLVERPDARVLACATLMRQGEVVSWPTFLLALTRFRQFTRRPECLRALLKILEKELDAIRCPYMDERACASLTEALWRVFEWVMEAVEASCDEDDEDAVEAAVLPDCLRAFEALCSDAFVSTLMQLRTASGQDAASQSSALLTRVAAVAQVRGDDESDRVEAAARRTFSPRPLPSYTSPICPSSTPHVSGSRSGVRTACSVFASYRIFATPDEVASTLLQVGRSLGMSDEAIVGDTLHAALNILLDEELCGEWTPRALIEAFVYLRLPKVLAALRQRGAVSEETVMRAIKRLMRDGRQVLDGLDSRCSESTRKVLAQLAAARVISHHSMQMLTQQREQQQRSLPPSREQGVLVITALNAKQAAEKVWQQEDKLLTLLLRLMGSGGTVFDPFCTTYIVDGAMSQLSGKLAYLNRVAECPGDAGSGANPQTRAISFDITFILLTRITYNYGNKMSLCEQVNGASAQHDNTGGVFYRWMSVYADCMRMGEAGKGPVEVTPERKDAYRDKVARLKERSIFWDPATVNYSDLVDGIPVIGDILLDEFREKRHGNGVKDVVAALGESCCCLLVCLIQWLESQPVDEARRAMAVDVRDSIDATQPDNKEDREKWSFVRMVMRRVLDEMCSGRPVPHAMAIFMISAAKRRLPRLHRRQVPEKEALKKTWLYAQRQHWASPAVLEMLDHCNRARQHRLWVEKWLHHVLKSRTSDALSDSMELVLGAALLDPVPSLLAISMMLTDLFIASDDEKAGGVAGRGGAEAGAAVTGERFDPQYLIPLAKFLVQVLLLSEWTVVEGKRQAVGEREADGAPPTKRHRTEGAASEADNDLSTDIAGLDATIDTIFNKFEKELRACVLKPSVSFIAHVMVQLASASHAPAHRSLVSRVPHSMLFLLARIEPHTVSIDLFSKFCDPRIPQHAVEKMQLACMLKGLDAIEGYGS